MYIHSRAAPPKLDVADWRLEVGGSAVAKPRSFTYGELLALPAVTLRRVLDCGVNCRAFFPKVSPYKSFSGCPSAGLNGTSARWGRRSGRACGSRTCWPRSGSARPRTPASPASIRSSRRPGSRRIRR
nr:molybdopterin-dependent oxidoreductase [Nannocystis pusilla]